MPNGTPTGDLIDRASRVILQLGLPTVFAAVLLWFVLSKLATSLDAMVDSMQHQTAALVEMQQRFSQRASQENEVQRQLLEEFRKQHR
jgi:hypothetical protein